MKNGLNKIWHSKFWWLFLLVILAAINFIASSFHYRFDLTKEKRYTLSTATKKLLKNLDEPVVIDVFLKGDFPSGFKKLANTTTELLQEFKENAGSKIIFNFIEPDELITGAIKYADTLIAMGAAPINLTVQLKAGEKQQYVFPMAWIRHKNRSTIVNIYTGGKRLITPEEMNSAEALMEYQFISAINKITKEAASFVGYTVGNGQPAGPEVSDLIEGVIRPNYNLFTLDLTTQPEIPDTFKVLLVVKPISVNAKK